MNTALKRAYELERKGLEFYITLVRKSKNVLARRTLMSLAREEIGHMMKIDEISLSLDGSGKWTGVEIAFTGSDIEIGIKGFFEQADKDALLESRDNADLIKKAMEFERKSYELYDGLSKKAPSDTEKRFYDELRKQEEAHFDALQNVFYYLTKTGDWFENDESNVWSWMNL